MELEPWVLMGRKSNLPNVLPWAIGPGPKRQPIRSFSGLHWWIRIISSSPLSPSLSKPSDLAFCSSFLVEQEAVGRTASMASMSLCSLSSTHNLLHHRPTRLPLQILRPNTLSQFSLKFPAFPSLSAAQWLRLSAVAEETASAPSATPDPSSEAARRLYVGNIPRNIDNAELTRIVEEHGSVEKAEVFGFLAYQSIELRVCGQWLNAGVV